MNNLPIGFKVIANIVFFVVYIVIFWIIGGILYGAYSQSILGVNPIDAGGDKLAIIIVVFVFIVTVILRKYFYFSLDTKN